MAKKHAMILLLWLSMTILSGCSNVASNQKQIDVLKPNWSGIDTSCLAIKFGDYVALKVDSNYVSGILIDYDQDTSGVWFGFCLTNLHTDISKIKQEQRFKLLASVIGEGFIDVTCLDGVHMEYIHQKGLNDSNTVFIRNYPLDINKITMGSRGACDSLNFLESYNYEIEARKRKTTECGIGLLSANAVRTKYIDLQQILR